MSPSGRLRAHGRRGRNHRTSSSDGASNSERLAGRHGVRTSRVQRRAGRMTGMGRRCNDGPIASTRRAGRPGSDGARRAAAERRRQGIGSQIRYLSPVASLCPAEDGSGRLACRSKRRQPCAGERRGIWRNCPTRRQTRRGGVEQAGQPRFRRVATPQSELGSIHGRQRLRQGVCRFLDRARTRFRGQEPNGSERRRARHGPVVPPTPEPGPDAFSYSDPPSA